MRSVTGCGGRARYRRRPPRNWHGCWPGPSQRAAPPRIRPAATDRRLGRPPAGPGGAGALGPAQAPDVAAAVILRESSENLRSRHIPSPTRLPGNGSAGKREEGSKDGREHQGCPLGGGPAPPGPGTAARGDPRGRRRGPGGRRGGSRHPAGDRRPVQHQHPGGQRGHLHRHPRRGPRDIGRISRHHDHHVRWCCQHARAGGGRDQPRHLGRLLMGRGPASPVIQEASASWRALGTGVQLVVTDAHQLAAARAMLVADLAAVDLACSRFRPDSELVSLDRADGPVTVSPLLAEAIGVALRAAELTGGDVDPTVGAAMNAVGYDRDFSLVKRDGPAVRLTVKTIPGWRQVEFDEQARLLRVPPGVRLDLGATAKAWAADRSAARIAAALGCGVLVSLGGDIAVSGQPPAGGWRIRVQDISGRPEDPPAGPSTVVAIHGGGLATSSTVARRWRRGGDLLHHILDPRTGLPAAPVWRTVSVAAASCTDANIASTAAIIKGHAAPAWLAGLGLPARLVDDAGQVHTIGGWPAEAAGGIP